MLHSGWGEDLTCLLLEWVPRGSLADLLDDRTRDDKSLDVGVGMPAAAPYDEPD